MKPWTEQIGACVVYVDRSQPYCRVTFKDGTYTEARPQPIAGYRLRAVGMGYPNTAEGEGACSVEHDYIHCYACRLLGLPESPMLRAVAHGTLDRHDPNAGGHEERLVLALQAYLNGGEYTEPLSGLSFRGYSLPAVRVALLHDLRRDEEG